MSALDLHRSLRTVFSEAGSSTADRWRALTACVFAFTLPLAPAVLPLLLALWVATILIDRGVWRNRPLLRIDAFAPAFWSVLLLLVHIVGMLWTSNTAFGWFDVGIKLPLLVLPMLTFLPGARHAGHDAVLLSFCAGNMIAVLVCLGLAAVRATSSDGLGIQEFITSAFSAVLHPSYFAWYLVTALACWFLGGLKDRVPRAAGAAFVVIMCVGLVFTGSRMGWITLPLVLVWSLIHGWRDSWTRRVLLTLLLLSTLGAVVLTTVSEHVRYRVIELFRPSTPAADPFSSAAVRTVTWKAAWEIGTWNMPMGTGTGDVKDELLLRYKEMGAQHALDNRLNAHNQFLQSFAALGFAGVLALVLMILLPLLRMLKRSGSDHALQACVLVLLLLNFSVESMLEVQAGTLFTGWLLWVLWWPRSGLASSPP